MTVHVVINPVSGNGLGLKLAHQCSCRRIILTRPGLFDCGPEFRIDPGDGIIIGGGDGTISTLVGCLSRLGLTRDTKIAILPIGTGNDLYRALCEYAQPEYVQRSLRRAIPSPADAATLLQTMLEPEYFDRKTVSLPVWSYGSHTFICYLGLGIDAAILASTIQLRARLPKIALITRAAYAFAGARRLRFRLQKHTEVTFSGRCVDLHNTAGVIISNISSYGGGSRIAMPEMGADKGLCITILKSPAELLRIILNRFYRGSYNTSADSCDSASKIGLDGSAVAVQADGEALRFAPGTITSNGCATLVLPKIT